MAYEDRLKTYQEKAYKPEYNKHVSKRIRTDYPEIPADMSDDEVLKAHRSLFGEGLNDESYTKRLNSAYADDFEPTTKAPEMNLLEKAGAIAPQVPGMALEMGKAMVPFVGAQIGQAVSKVPGVGQAALAANTGVKLAGEQLAGTSLEKTAAEMPEPNIASLRARGYSEAQIHNIVNGYTQVQHELMGEMQKIGEEGITDTSEGIANAALFKMGTGAVTKLAQNVTGKVAAKAGAKAAISGLVSGTAGHIASGATFGASFSGLMEATERMAKAKEAGLGADDIWKAGVEGGIQGLKTGAVIGGLIGGVLGGTATAFKSAREVFENVSVTRKAVAQRAVEDARRVNLQKFVNEFKPSELPTRFSEDLAFAAQNGLDDAALAKNIVAATQGADVAASEDGLRAASKVYEKIVAWREIRDRIGGPMVSLAEQQSKAIEPPAGSITPTLTPEQQALGLAPPIEGVAPPQPGGIAPQPGMTAIGPGLQTPGPQPFVPPAQAPMMPGVQPVGAPIPVQERPPITVGGVQPSEGAPQLSQPIGVEPRRAMGPAEQARVEPQLRELPPGAPVPVAPIEASAPQAPPVTNPLLEGARRAVEISGTPEEQMRLLEAERVSTAPAEGLAKTTTRPEGNPVARGVVENYVKDKGLSQEAREIYPPVNKERARTTALAYDKMKNAKPGTPEYEAAQKSYEALNREIADQFKAIEDSGFKIEFTPEDPYPNSAAMKKDVAENHRLKVLSSSEAHHPFMTSDQTNKFRAVHDFFGHAAEGFEFGPRGEDAAFRQHAATLTNDAIPALTTETRGQNSWVNFLPKNEKLPAKERPFAEQKFGLLPRTTYEEVLHPTGVMDRVSGLDPEQAMMASGNVSTGRPMAEAGFGERLGKFLDTQATAAQKRIAARGTRLYAMGLDPAAIADHSIVTAAEMFSKGMRTKAAVTDWLVNTYGETIRPYIDAIYQKARDRLTKMFKTEAGATKKLNTLISLRDSGKHGMNWYEETADWANKTFGPDADMFLRFLAATSANSSTEAGAALSMKAYSQWKQGLPFDGMRGSAMVTNLNQAARGEPFGGDKISSFYQALKGDKDAVVLDRWMIRALGLPMKKGSLGENDYKLYSQIVRNLAEQSGMTPRQFQAAIWEGARVGTAHERMKEGGAKAVSKIGSARPLEQLIQREFGDSGMTPYQWVERNRIKHEDLANMTSGLQSAKEVGGHTFNPNTWAPDNKPGYVVTLLSDVIPKKNFYPPALTKFKNQVARVISESAFGGPHVNIGVWNLKEHNPGHYSIDLNTVIPADSPDALATAKKIGKATRQFAIGEIGENGKYVQDHPTGYTPKKDGPQFTPPLKGSERAAWFKQAVARARNLLDQIEFKLTPKEK